MSLATRCTACGTVFRIVEDQLRVSDGWVRCGRCAEIFDARELLFDIEREAPPPWSGGYAQPPAAAPVQAPPPPPPPPPPAPPPEPEPVWTPEPQAEPRSEPRAGGWPPEPERREPRWVEDGDAGQGAAAPEAEPALTQPAPAPEPPPMTAEPAVAAAPAVVPEFMRRAESSARWNRPAVRLALALLSLLLVLALLLQVALHFRDALGALHPPLRGALQAACSLFGCEVKPWRRIEAISIDTTSLSPAGSGNSYKLVLTISNAANVAVATPWIDLRLTDASGAPLARRVFEPAALSPALQELPALSEQTLSLTFRTTQAVSGYQVNAFHP
ncbi:MAG: zinc-ribbon and DUF3426 domain-containing protein [Roseateles sp.]